MYPGGYYFSQPTPNKGPGQKAPPPPRYPHPGGTSSSNNYASQTNYNKGYSSSAARAAPKPEEFKTPIAPNTVIRVYTTDITRLEVDAVVNASNQNLKHLGGVAGALLAAAGYQLQTATEDYLWKNHLHEIPVGNAMHTPGFLLPAKHVIHAVGPSGHDIRDEKKFRQLLENAFLNTFKEAQSLEVKTLGLPLISSGVPAILFIEFITQLLRFFSY